MTSPPEEVVAEQKRDQRRTGVILIAVALVGAIALGAAYRTDKRADASDEKAVAYSSQVKVLTGQVKANGQLAQSAKDVAEEANRRLRAAGEPTVPVPTVSPISPPLPSERVESLTVDQVRAIVVTELAQHKAQLSQAEISQIARVAAAMVPKPADGKTPTKAELQPVVVAALAAYCVDDKCVGKPGEDGKDGSPGADGAPGKDAPRVTDEQLLAAAQAALQAYCAAESQPCKGPQGEPGATVTGPPGPAGRGIKDTDCQDDGTWLITYSDGTKEAARGPCRIVVAPTGTGN